MARFEKGEMASENKVPTPRNRPGTILHLANRAKAFPHLTESHLAT